MESLSVLHVNSAKTWRGGEQQTLYLARGLRDKGHDISIACQPGSPLEARARDDGLTVMPVNMRGEWDLFAVAKLAYIIREEKVQILHLHTACAHTLGFMAAKITRRPKVVLSRRVYVRIRKNPLSFAKYFMGLDRIIAVSEGVRELVIKSGISPEKIVVVHDGIDLERFNKVNNNKYLYDEFDLNPRNPVVGTVAALTAEKDYPNFLKAAVQVKARLPQARFLIVGEGKLRKELEVLAERLGLGSSVIFAGFRNDIPEIFSILDLFVMPSYKEGLGTSILDAMVSRVPVVATKVGGIPELVKDGFNGILVPAGNPSALASGIISLLQDEKMAADMVRAGRQMVEEEFTEDRMVAQTEEVYSQLWLE